MGSGCGGWNTVKNLRRGGGKRMGGRRGRGGGGWGGGGGGGGGQGAGGSRVSKWGGGGVGGGGGGRAVPSASFRGKTSLFANWRGKSMGK